MGTIISEYEWMQHFKDVLKDQLQYNEMSQRDLAEQATISESTISSYINMQKMPSVRSILNICWVLGISTDELINYGKKME